MARSGPRKIARYGDRFKATAVKLSSLPRVLIQDVAAALDIHPFMSLWRKQVLDEVIVACSDLRLAQLLVDFKWKELFWINRDAVIASMKFFLFGHAIYEKALQPFTGVTGRGVIFLVAADFFAAALEQQLRMLDEKLAGYLNNPQHFNCTAELAPIPILGIPGWNAENEREAYYENEAYFRAGRNA